MHYGEMIVLNNDCKSILVSWNCKKVYRFVLATYDLLKIDYYTGISHMQSP